MTRHEVRLKRLSQALRRGLDDPKAKLATVFPSRGYNADPRCRVCGAFRNTKIHRAHPPAPPSEEAT